MGDTSRPVVHAVGITEEVYCWGAAWQTLNCFISLNGDLSKEKYSWVDI